MTENPLIVFVRPDRVPVELKLKAEDFPIGVKLDGARSSVQQNERYALLLLDDEKPVPDIVFANRDPKKLLLIIAHNTSEANRAPENSDRLKDWGMPYVCEWFSHLKRDETWTDIQSLVRGSFTPAGFIEKHRNNVSLELYDRLAAICQLITIDPDQYEPCLPELEYAVNHLPRGFGDEFAGISGWHERLRFVREKATPLAR